MIPHVRRDERDAQDADPGPSDCGTAGAETGAARSSPAARTRGLRLAICAGVDAAE
ncbi:MAG: hypothetical protein U0575_10255 [Phycisphaerales bacterium]